MYIREGLAWTRLGMRLATNQKGFTNLSKFRLRKVRSQSRPNKIYGIGLMQDVFNKSTLNKGIGHCMGTSLIRKRYSLGSYSRYMRRALWRS